MTLNLIILSLALSVLAITLIRRAIRWFSSNYRRMVTSNHFTGDYKRIDPRKHNGIHRSDILAGDIDLNPDYDEVPSEEDDDDEDSMAALGDIVRMSVIDPNDFISGDIDREYDNSRLTQGDFLEGGFFKKVFNKKKSKGAKMTQATFASKAAQILGGQQEVKGSKYPNNLVAQKALANVIKSTGTLEEKEAAISQIANASAVPGALLSNVDIARIAVAGGSIKIPQTLLKIPGKNLAEAIKLYEAQYPGISRSISQIATNTGLLSFSFPAPTGKEISKVIAIFIRFAASPLTRTDAEIGITISSAKINTFAHSFNGTDRVIIFSDGAKETNVTLLPVIEVREKLFCVPFDIPAADPNDIQIDLSGVPTDTNVTVRLAGVDSSEWVDYKNMLGLR